MIGLCIIMAQQAPAYFRIYPVTSFFAEKEHKIDTF